VEHVGPLFPGHPLRHRPDQSLLPNPKVPESASVIESRAASSKPQHRCRAHESDQ